MRTMARVVLVALGVTGAWGGAAAGWVRGSDGPPDAAKVEVDACDESGGAVSAGQGEPTLAEELDRVRKEYEAARQAFMKFYQGSTIPQEQLAEAIKVRPDYSSVVRKLAELGSRAPTDPAVRDAMVWVLSNGLGGGDSGPLGGEFATAANWLVTHFGDDPEAVRAGLELDSILTAYRDHLVLGFYASAKSRESKGLARLALAQFLERKALFAKWARKKEGRATYVHEGLVRADGTLYTKTQVQPDDEYAYQLHLKQCDPDYLSAEAERLYEEVILEYGDVPYVRTRDRRLERLVEEANSGRSDEPLTEETLQRIKTRLAQRGTLGDAAQARLDAWFNLAVGKEAPEVEGVDFEGRPMKLSDYRGKVIMLVFWGSWCGPCMQEVPHEKELAERMKGRPFVLLGVNCNEPKEVAMKAMETHGMTWRNWHDGDYGPVARRYRIRSYPTVYVIDGEGKIGTKQGTGSRLSEFVEGLVVETEKAAIGE